MSLDSGCASGALPANQRYYIGIGRGRWEGRFTFTLTDWVRFWREPISPRDRFLTLCFVSTLGVLGWAAITSVLVPDAERRQAVRVRNRVRIHRFGVTLYTLAETYTLDAGGSGVIVDAEERFGPVPFLFRDRKRHTAEVLDGGMRAVYALPLLGTQWVAMYQVLPDGRHIDSTLRCAWAEGHERIARMSE